MQSFFKKIAGFKNKLTRLNDDEPVTKLALAIIILLDVFILAILFGGLEDHTGQLTAPDEYFPFQCRQVFITKEWTEANRMDRLQHLVLTDYDHYSYQFDSPFDASKVRKMHPLCGAFFEKIRLLKDNTALKDLFIERRETGKKKDQHIRQHNTESGVYETKLLEDIADKRSDELKSMAALTKARSKEIDSLNAQIQAIERTLNADSQIMEFWALTHLGDDVRRERLTTDLNRYEKIYLLREFMWQMLFLLPLLIVFCVWHAKSVKKDRTVQGLISAHLIVVASIPVLFKVIHVVLELIPYHFFKDLFNLLERLHIIAVWHYGVILVSIGVVLLLVFIIQKKIFNPARLYEKRLSKGLCYSCGKRLPETKSPVCPFCGAKQMRECAACGHDTYINGKFCDNCGQFRSGVD